jgi:putative endonuclease
MSGEHHAGAFGRAAEEAAVALLTARGMTVIGRNVRTPDGEIDIIAKDGRTVVFVEVKARRTRAYGSALGAVDARKRRRLRRIAADYLQIVAPGAAARFDVVTVERGVVTLYKDAYR